MTQKLERKIMQVGYTLPAPLLAPVKWLWHPLLFDWVITSFSFGYALVVLIMGANALHLGVYQGPLVLAFSPYTTGFAATMLLASGMGLVGLYRLDKKMRLRSSFFLVLAYAWVAVYYVKAVPLPWQAVFIFLFHGTMEAAVYFRTATDPRHLWSSSRE